MRLIRNFDHGTRDDPHAAWQVLAVNGGSSSIKFALFEARAGFARRLHGLVDRIGGLVLAHLGNVE